MPDGRLEICAYCQTPTWCEIRKNGKPQCKACKVERFFEEVLYKPSGLRLLEWQRRVLRDIFGTVDEQGVRRYRRAYISVAKKNGKQLSLATQIPTPDGWRTMGQIEPGSLVFSETGHPINVIARSEIDESERAFKLHFSDGTNIVAGERHQWLVQHLPHRSQQTISTTADMWLKSRNCNRSQFRIPLAAPLQFPMREDLPVDPYLFGFWVGNGTATKPEVTVNRADVTDFIANCRHEITSHAEQDGFSDVLRVPALKSALVSHFTEKRIPVSYLRGSVEQRWTLLSGLMDSDGCISSSGQAIYSTSLQDLAKDVLELLRSLAIKATINRVESDRYGKPNHPNYRVLFTAFTDMPCSRLSRKLQNRKVRDSNSRSHFSYIEHIEEVQRVPMRCIEVDSDSHLYLAGDGMIPTHNSFLVGGLPLYHLLMENERNPEAYGAAASKDQAGIVFRAAANMARSNPVLTSRLKLLENTKRIVRRDSGGFYAVISADGDLQDGIEPSLGIMDELHRWRAPKSETNYDVITKGTLSRKEPLIVEITTAGEKNDSPICWREHEYAQQVLEGSLKSDRFYAAIYAADAERAAKEPDYWMSREARVAANPSHEDLGGFLKDEAIVQERDKAIALPSERSKYFRYNLNIWVEAEERFIDPSAWAKCSVPQRSLVGRPCYIGLDLSSTIDLTAMVCVFPDDDGTYDVTANFWMASEQVATRERRDRVEYSTWIRHGYLNFSRGWAIDEEDVRQAIKAAAALYDVRMICYDPRFATSLVNKLINEDGFLCVKISQGFQALTQPTKTLQGLILDGKIRHGGHPVLDWNFACATAISDKKEGVMLAKPDRMRSGKRIDGAAALVNAISQATVQQMQGEMIGFY